MKEVLPIERITSRIYVIRGIKVMLDRDLAELYGVETKVLKQAVKRNIDRFPADFMFELSKPEFENWRSQFVTSKSDKMGLRYAKSTAEPIDGFDLTPQARVIWDAIPGNSQLQLLNNVWCGSCRKATGIGGGVSGKLEKGLLVLHGSCTKCGGEVVRVIENE